MGRTNKLVDGCYSFWQGALFPLLQRLSPQLLAQTSVPLPPASAAPVTSVASLSGGDGSGKAGGNSRKGGGPEAASQSFQHSSSGAASDSGGTGRKAAQGPAAKRIVVPPLPDILACGPPAAAARAQAAALKATADAAVQAALAAQLSTASAGGAAGPASGWQRRELASERVRQLADTAGAALEVRLTAQHSRKRVDSFSNQSTRGKCKSRCLLEGHGPHVGPVMVALQINSGIACCMLHSVEQGLAARYAIIGTLLCCGSPK